MDKLKFEEYSGVDFWSIFFSVLSFILFILSLLVPSERKLLIIVFATIALICAVFVFYIQEINHNKKFIKMAIIKVNRLSDELLERFNYMKEISNIKEEISMLKRKRGQVINLLEILKILVAAILIYVIYQTIKSLI